MIFATILADTYDRLHFPASPAAAVSARIKRLCNEAHRELLALPGMMKLREDLLSLSVAASVPRTALPQAIGRIRHITDRAHMWTLEEIPLNELRARNPGRINQGSPMAFAVAGYQPVALQPSDASELFIKSTSPSDTNTAYLEGIRSNGSLVSLSITMTGVTAKSFGVTEAGIVEVTKLYLSAAAVGDVTLLEDSSSGTELAKIAIGRTFARYLTVEWDPIPSSAVTFYVDAIRNVPDLVADGDEPLLPEDFHYLVGLRARQKHYEIQDDAERALELRSEYADGKAALRSWVLNDGGKLTSLRPLPRSMAAPSFGSLVIGAANFAASAVTADPVSPADGDIWVLRTSTSPLTYQIRARYSGVTYTLYEVAP